MKIREIPVIAGTTWSEREVRAARGNKRSPPATTPNDFEGARRSHFYLKSGTL